MSPVLPDSPSLAASCFPLKYPGLQLDTPGPVEPMTLDLTSAINSDDETGTTNRHHIELTRHIEREMEEMNINTGFEKRFHGKVRSTLRSRRRDAARLGGSIAPFLLAQAAADALFVPPAHAVLRCYAHTGCHAFEGGSRRGFQEEW